MKNSPIITNVILALLIALSFVIIISYTNSNDIEPPPHNVETKPIDTGFKQSPPTSDLDNAPLLVKYYSLDTLFPDRQFFISSEPFTNNGNSILCSVDKESFISPDFYSSFKANDTGDIFYPTDTTKTLDDKPAFISVNSFILSYPQDRSKIILNNLGNPLFEDAQNDYAFTWLTDANGENVFKKDGLFYRFDDETQEFIETQIPAGDMDFIAFSKGYFTPALLSYNSDDTNLTRTSVDGFVGYSDGENEIIPANYKISFGFVNGFVALSDFETVHIYNENGERILEDADFILPDKSGIELLGFYRLRNGIMRVCVLDEVTQEKIEKAIYITGEEITFDKPYEIVSYTDGIFLVKHDDLYEYVTPNGKSINGNTYSFARPFCEGIAVVQGENGKLGAINTRGKLVIPFEYDEICDMSGGVMTAYSNETHWNIINKLEKF